MGISTALEGVEDDGGETLCGAAVGFGVRAVVADMRNNNDSH